MCVCWGGGGGGWGGGGRGPFKFSEMGGGLPKMWGKAAFEMKGS